MAGLGPCAPAICASSLYKRRLRLQAGLTARGKLMPLIGRGDSFLSRRAVCVESRTGLPSVSNHHVRQKIMCGNQPSDGSNCPRWTYNLNSTAHLHIRSQRRGRAVPQSFLPLGLLRGQLSALLWHSGRLLGDACCACGSPGRYCGQNSRVRVSSR